MLVHHMCRRTCHLCYVQKTRAPTTETRLPLRYPLSPCWMVPPRLRFGPTAGADAPSVPPSRLPSAGVVHDNPDPCLTNISEARRKDLGISSASSRGIIFCITATNVKVLSLLGYRLLSQKKGAGGEVLWGVRRRREGMIAPSGFVGSGWACVHAVAIGPRAELEFVAAPGVPLPEELAARREKSQVRADGQRPI